MLNGLKIIDFTNYLPGPFASMRLAELGAEVIKVESIDGDPARHMGVKKDDTGLVFLANNRKKKSISLDLKKEKDREIVIQLIAEADAVLESFRPGVMKKLGLDYETVCTYKEDIVYCSITGYGNNNQWSKLGSHDLNYMAVSGVLAQFKNSRGKPVHPSITLADYMGGFAACERILAGIVSKSITGKGSYHCVSITDTMAAVMGNHLLYEQETGDPSGISLLNGNIVSYQVYEVKGGRFISLAALEPKFWRNFCLAVGREDWLDHHLSEAVSSNSIYEQVRDLFLSQTLSEWIQFGEDVDCCLAPVLEVNELANHPLFKERQVIFQQHGIPQVKMHGDLEVSNTMGSSPAIGEHTKEIVKRLQSTERF